MRNLKKFLALVLAMIMVVGATAVVSADFTDVAADSNYAAAINDLAVKGIIKGISETTFGPEQDVTREQMALFFARSTTGETDDAAWNTGIVPFTDIDKYAGAIEVCFNKKIIDGKSATIFDPYAGITYAEGLKMAVCALGYGVDEDGNKLDYPWGYVSVAGELGLTKNITTVETVNESLTREEVAQIIYNLVYATPADGTPCFAAKYFDMVVAGNSELFVISATPEQWHGVDYEYTASASDKGAVYVGVQKLVAGVPTGELYYVKAADLGIADADVEKYFFYSVELVNFDAATGEFGRAILGDAPKAVKDAEVGNNGYKLTIDEKTYTPIDSYVSSTLINNLVIYNSMNIDNSRTFLDIRDELGSNWWWNDYYGFDAKVYDINGNLVAYRITSGATGDGDWYYYDALFYDIATGKVITYVEAAAKYGYTLAHGAINAGTLLNKEYVLNLFDDNRDGVYDRAIYTPIFMGAYYTYAGANSTTWDGLIRDLGNELGYDYASITKEAVYTNENAKVQGAISVYSYNPQLNVVTVYGLVTPKTGVISKITPVGGTNWRGVSTVVDLTLTIDGKDYPLYYFEKDAYFWQNGDMKKNSTAPSTLGAYVVQHDSVYSLNNQAPNAILWHYNSSNHQMAEFYNKARVGGTVLFYEYNGYILMAEMVERSILEDWAVIVEPRIFNVDGTFNFDLYVGGKFVELATISVLNGTYIGRFAGYDWDYVDFINCRALSYPGSIYYNADGIATFGSYELDKLVAAEDLGDYGFEDATVAGDNGKIKFTNGYTTGAALADRLYTNANTVWYFINEEEMPAGWVSTPAQPVFTPDPMKTTVRAYVGSGANNFIEYDADTYVWTDSIGYNSAAAKLIFVINSADHDFFRASDKTSLITFLSVDVNGGIAMRASDLGLPKEYTGKYYMYQSCKIYDLDKGVRVTTVFSKDKINTRLTYVIDEYNVVTPTTETIFATSKIVYFNTEIYNIQNVTGDYYGTLTADMTDDEILALEKISIRDYQMYVAGTASQSKDYTLKTIVEEVNGKMEVVGTEVVITDTTRTSYKDLPANWYELDKCDVNGDPDSLYDAIGKDPAGNYYVDFADDFTWSNGKDANYYNIEVDDKITELVVMIYGEGGPRTGDDALNALKGASRVSAIDNVKYNVTTGVAMFYIMGQYEGGDSSGGTWLQETAW